MNHDEEFAAELRARIGGDAPDLAVDTSTVLPRARRRRRVTRGAAAGGSFVLVGGLTVALVTASTGAAAPDLTPAGPSGSTASATPEEEPGTEGATAEGTTTNPRPLGPLEEYIERVAATDGTADDEEYERVGQLAIQECMAERGFDEYVPIDEPDGGTPTYTYATVQPDTLEYATQWGYGITMEGPQDVVTWDDDDAWAEYEEPNAAMTADWPADRATAFWDALTGEGSWATGCQQLSVAATDAVDTLQNRFADLYAEIDDVESWGADDPRVLAAHAAWSACMAEAGYDGLEHQAFAYNEVTDRVQELDGSIEVVDLPGGRTGQRVSGVTPDQLKEIQAFEVRIATADVTCQEEVGFDETVRDVSWTLQQEYVDANRARLDEWVAAAEGR